MIPCVRDVEISFRIEGQTPRVAETSRFGSCAADDLDRPILPIKDLNPAVAKFADKLMTLAVHAHIIGIAHLAQPGSGLAKAGGPRAVRCKDLNAMIARIGHMQSLIGTKAQAFRAVELARPV